MQRRHFLATSLAASAATLTDSLAAQTAASSSRELYQLRRYHLQSGPQIKLTQSYFADALIPALTRMGLGPIGAFSLQYGPETPAFYLLIPSQSAELLATLDLHLAEDVAFLKAAEPFWSAPATAPPFERIDTSLLQAFAGWPKLAIPAIKGKRIFQLRTYESPSHAAHVRKIEMFHSGEFEIFQNAGCNPVFFSDTLIGPRMPSLTYMLSYSDLAALDKGWQAFVSDPAWKKLSSSPRYNYEAIVSNISNLILSPLPSSQI
ncbi:NIPSNAP family protein [Granulicella arctica]|uniref:NIPSNAP domain-containing protein n=1 Tax=Granulicella arctica TaxID=940613 RepID=A0A7Y9PD83_9BACT|nr:NIPSNAP family protein [Granulicella arctica]NYF77719.1 hypothetical protein [Granulicella arctica]